MSLRILHVLDHSIPLHSGYAFRTLSILREQQRLGWTTFHITGTKHLEVSGLEEAVDGLQFFRTPAVERGSNVPVLREWAAMLQLKRRLREVVDQVRPDLIHAHSPVLNALPALSVARESSIPFVYEIRAFWEDAAVDHGTTREGSMRYRLTRRVETHAVRSADHVFTICEGLRRDIVGRGVPAGRVSVIPNAVDVQSFGPGAPADEVLKARLGLGGCRVIGFIGSFYAYEGLDLLLQAMNSLCRSHGDVRVLLVGGGPQEEALKRQTRELGLKDRVVFAGRVPHREVQRYYDLVDVLAYPRHSMRLTELVTPLKPLEAMAQGRLFVASDVGGHKELISDGVNGVLFPAGDAPALAQVLGDLLASPDRWPALRVAGRRYVEQERNWPNSVQRYAPVYQRLSQAAAR